MTKWTPALHVVAVGQAHLYLVPDNGSLSRVWTVEWDPATVDKATTLSQRATHTALGLRQLFNQVGAQTPDDVHDLVNHLWATLDRRVTQAPAV